MSASPDTPLSAGELIVANVAAHGIDTVFAIPGAQTYPLFDGFHRFGLRVLVPRHEQAAAYMAMGAAKSTGQAAVFSVVPGPGLLNAAAALCTAHGNCSPVICLTGEVPSAYKGRGRGHLHELRDQLGTLRSIIKNASEVSDLTDIALAVGRAFQAARSDRPGPASLQMCWDTMAQEVPQPTILNALPVLRPELDPDQIAAAATLIAGAKRPMIMCGAGAQDASEAVLELARALGAPVTAFRSGRGVVPEDDPLSAPPVAARLLWDEVDLLIGIGSRLEMPYARWRSPMVYEAKPAGPALVRIDIDPTEMARLVPDVGVVGDAAEACAALLRALAGHKIASTPTEQLATIASANAKARKLIAGITPQADYLRVIRDVVPRDGFIVPELSQVGFTTYTGALPILTPRSYVTEGHQGTLGFGFPTALGVKVANPQRAVVSITGDGGFMFGLQELATAAEHSISVVVLLFNNGAYANVLRDQERTSGRVIASTFTNPDFLALAEAFGVAAERIDSPATLRPALERALAADAPRLIEIAVAPRSETSPWPLIHMLTRPDLQRNA